MENGFKPVFGWFSRNQDELGIRISKLHYRFVLCFLLPVGSIGSGSRSNLGLPLVPISQQFLLVVQQFFTVLGGVFSVGGCTGQLSVMMYFKVN